MAMVPTICLGTRSSWKQTISCFRACAVPQKTIEKAAPMEPISASRTSELALLLFKVCREREMWIRSTAAQSVPSKYTQVFRSNLARGWLDSLYHGAARVKSRAAQAPGPQKPLTRDIPSGSGGAEVIGRFKGVGVHRPVVEVAASEAALGELAVGMIVV